MERKLYTPQEVTEFITKGKKLVLTADEKLLDKLPKGNWIAGTIPYFMDKDGGIKSKEKIFVDDFTSFVDDFKISNYTAKTIKNIATDGFENGFTVLVISANSQAHIDFSLNSFDYENIFKNPIIGYIAGIDLDNTTTDKAYTYSGTNNEKSNDNAVAIHFKLPDNKIANVEIINIFHRCKNSPIVKFPKTGFVQSKCTIDNKEVNLADYIIENNIDIKFPLIENQNGALINKSFMKIDEQTKEVEFYAPVFNDVDYVFAEKIDNYVEKLNFATVDKREDIKYSCNCILNYLFGELENKKIKLSGATTFGEIAYQLLNQTQILLKIENF